MTVDRIKIEIFDGSSYSEEIFFDNAEVRTGEVGLLNQFNTIENRETRVSVFDSVRGAGAENDVLEYRVSVYLESMDTFDKIESIRTAANKLKLYPQYSENSDYVEVVLIPFVYEHYRRGAKVADEIQLTFKGPV